MKNVFPFLVLALLGLHLKAQDPHFTQFNNVPLFTNPAYAGSAINGKDDAFTTRINLGYRNQWPSSDGIDQTVNASWDRHFNKLQGGLGGFITRNVIGGNASSLLYTSNIGAIYAPHFTINQRISIRGGLQASFVNKQLDFSGFYFDTTHFTIDPNLPLPAQSISFPNFAISAIAYMKNYHLGFAVHNLLEPNQSFYGSADGILPRRYTVHAGANFEVFKGQSFKSSFSPYALFMQQQNFNQLNLITNLNLGRVLVGAGFRQTAGQFGNFDAAIGIVGYKAPRYHFTYSYDRTVSSASSAMKGSHEFSMNYFISLKKNLPSIALISPSY